MMFEEKLSLALIIVALISGLIAFILDNWFFGYLSLVQFIGAVSMNFEAEKEKLVSQFKENAKGKEDFVQKRER